MKNILAEKCVEICKLTELISKLKSENVEQAEVIKSQAKEILYLKKQMAESPAGDRNFINL